MLCRPSWPPLYLGPRLPTTRAGSTCITAGRIRRPGRWTIGRLAAPAFKELDGFNSFMDSVQWRLTHPESTASMWFCLSLQKHTHEVLNKHGKVKAQRNVKDAVGLKSIWIDIDIKPNNPKCYPDINTALLAFEAFRVRNGLPDPSAIVRSGGGVHIYYINRDTLTPDDWRVYAGGLKQLCLNEGLLVDAGLMTDASRVLRVPGTFNYKTDPPKPVKLLTKTLRIYDFEPTLAFLQKFAIAPR